MPPQGRQLAQALIKQLHQPIIRPAKNLGGNFGNLNTKQVTKLAIGDTFCQ
jgi:hypothetical protein